MSAKSNDIVVVVTRPFYEFIKIKKEVVDKTLGQAEARIAHGRTETGGS
jgi:hypothetical protein